MTRERNIPWSRLTTRETKLRRQSEHTGGTIPSPDATTAPRVEGPERRRTRNAKRGIARQQYSLPECELLRPKESSSRHGRSTVRVSGERPVTVTADITVKALWEDASPAPTEYTVTVTSGGNGTASASHAKAAAGTTITLTATPDRATTSRSGRSSAAA